ncbi:MAG: hypothetical protein IJ455_04925 [Agathobacter sp.]|nr:hypothetical protein [Agathobacter sp.]
MKAYTKDIIKTIVKGMKRFMALAIIAALGVCMMSGLKASCDDLRLTADDFYDQQNLFDIMVVSTMGLTEDDVEVLAKIEGIEDVEGAYSETVYTQVNGQTKQATVNVLSQKDINVPYVIEGEMPLRSDEIVVTQKFMNESGKQLGDKLVIEEDMDEEDDEEDSDEDVEEDTEEEDNRFDLDLEKEYEFEEEESEEEDLEVEVEEEEEEPNFLVTEYTIVGVVIDVTDINSQEGAVAFRANNTTDYTFFVLPEAVSSDIFTAVYITLNGTDELRCYSEEYETKVDEIVSILEEEIKADREQARYDEVTGEALEKVDDAEAEVNDKLADAEKDILDAKVEIEDGWSELLDGKNELLDGENDLAEAERKLLKAQRELEKAERELAKAEEELEAAWDELEAGETMVEEGEAALDEAETTLDESEASLNEAEAELPDQFDTSRRLINSQINSIKIDIAETENEISKLETEIAKLKEEQAELEAKEEAGTINAVEAIRLLEVRANLTEKETTLDLRKQELDNLNEQLDVYNDTLDDLNQQEEDAYQEIADGRAEIAEGRQEIADNRAELEKNKADLAEGRKELEDAQAEFDQSRKDVDDGWDELEDGWDELEEAYQKIADGKNDLEKGEAEFEDGKQKYEDGVNEFLDRKQEALDKIAEARQEIADLKMTSWYISTRTALSGYSNVKTDAQCIESIGNAFPILFLTVAILISLTTISRMVEEDRGLIGTYKALGFTDKEIRRKYVVYALLACVVGGLLGLFLGFIVLPEIIFTVFGVMYQFQNYSLAFNWLYGMGGIVLFMIAIVGSAVISCSTELSHMPAMLMRPKAPKNGSRVLLERVTPVWSRFSFLNKVTARNLFRYKKRLFMTLFGIAGCTSILLAGFTIKDTVTRLMPMQYEVTYNFDVMIVSDDNEQLLEYLDDNRVRAYLNPMITNVKVINEDGREESVQLVVVPNEESLRGYINLVDREGNKVLLEDGMVLSTINVAEVQGYDEGDTITLQSMNLENAEVEITRIVMNYLGNTIYMTQNTYEDFFDDYEANGAYVMLNKGVGSHEEYAEAMAEKDGILSAISIEGFLSNFDNVFRIINLVVTIVITLAAALAFVVLFTLSTTNISERERELATIKVLGFFDREVHLYVNKETLILTGLGILLGMPLGKGFGIWLMAILKMPSIYFADYLAPISYLYAAVIAIIFAFIVNKITDKSLDKIDPVEALKSIE